MALRPCAVKQHRYIGPAQWAYPAILFGSDRLQAKKPMCPEHFQQYVDLVDANLVPVRFEEQGEAELNATRDCAQCDQPIEGEHAIAFCTVYERGQERRDYFGELHKHCISLMQHTLGV